MPSNKIQNIHRIAEIKGLRATFEFNDGELREVDFAEMLKSYSTTADNAFKPLFDGDYFRTMQLNQEWGTIFWDNGIDLDPIVLFEKGKYIGKVTPLIKEQKMESNNPWQVSAFYGMKITMKPDEIVPPHFDVQYNEQQAILSVATGELLQGNISKRGLKLVREWTNLHRTKLLDNFKELQKKNPQLMKIEPLD